MKKTIIEEYDSNGKLIKKTTIEEDTDKHNGIYSHNNSITWQPGVREPLEYLDKSIICTASGATEATFKGE